MTIPKSAIYENSINFGGNEHGGIVIYDVSIALNKISQVYTKKAMQDGKVLKKPFGYRDPTKISKIIVHKSGSNGPAGYDGCVATTRFVVYHRGWSGPAYTFWIPREPDMDDGWIVVYRMQPDNVRSWHTGGKMNEIGIGIGVQGNYDGEWDLLSSGLPKVDRMPTPAQYVALGLLIKYASERYNIDICGQDKKYGWNLTGHWEHGKAVCPGDALRQYVIQNRQIKNEEIREEYHKPAIDVGVVDPYKFSPKEYQRALQLLGFYSSKVDGILGDETRAALEAFQLSVGLVPDGWYGTRTADALKVELIDNKLLSKSKFWAAR